MLSSSYNVDAKLEDLPLHCCMKQPIMSKIIYSFLMLQVLAECSEQHNPLQFDSSSPSTDIN